MKALADQLNERFAGKQPEEVLAYFLKEYQGHIALASSLGIEDQVLTDMICKIAPETRIFTLDTGRLFPETYSLIERTNMTYGIKIQLFFPDYRELEKMVGDHGVNLFSPVKMFVPEDGGGKILSTRNVDCINKR